MQLNIGMQQLDGGIEIPVIEGADELPNRIVEMIWEDLTPDNIITEESVEDAVTVAMATGCSTNAVIHLIAMARRAGIDLTLADLDAKSRTTPVIPTAGWPAAVRWK